MYTDKQIMYKLEDYLEEIESHGYTVHAIMLKGSQNYNLSDEESDIDANAILIPTLRQIRTGIKEKFTFDTGEVTCHDIYSFADIVAKGNPQWVEVCHTKYKLGGSLDIFKHFTVNPSALKGMMMEKVVAFDKLYPSRAHMVEKFGYDPKQLHHIIRLYDLLKADKKLFRYIGEDQQLMMDIKRGRFPTTATKAFALRDKYVALLSNIYEDRKLAYQPQSVDYDGLDKIVMSYYKED